MKLGNLIGPALASIARIPGKLDRIRRKQKKAYVFRKEGHVDVITSNENEMKKLRKQGYR